MGRLDDGDKIKYYHYHAYAMLGFDKLAGNTRRFKMLMGSRRHSNPITPPR